MIDYPGLFAGYAAAMIGWLVVVRGLPLFHSRWAGAVEQLWPAPEPVEFDHPWKEVGWAILAVAATLGIGQVYVHGWRLPAPGMWGLLTESINQLVIFAPLLALPLWRGHPARSVWLSGNRIGWRLLAGLGFATIAIACYLLIGGSDRGFGEVWVDVFSLSHLPHAVQILCEDIAIALLFVRLQAALGPRIPIVLVAVLFSAGHIPAMLAGGAVWVELGGLVLDAALGVGIIAVLRRSADVWWFWCVHFAMDMMQFVGT